jgi:hypothetical protein
MPVAESISWSPILIVVLVAGVLVGIGYAATVLVLWSRLTGRGWRLGLHLLKVFVPFCWPSLFRQTR